MARTKNAVAKQKGNKRHEMIDTKTADIVPATSFSEKINSVSGSPMNKWMYLLGAIIVLAGGYLFFHKGLIVAATVNGAPIYRWDLNSQLQARFGTQTLESMISERLVSDEAKKAGVTVTQSDITQKEKDIVGSLGANVNIDDLLKYQGMTKADFESQIRLQLSVEKILGKSITITDDDVTNFIATNAGSLTATDETGMRGEARQAILSQKISEKLQPWFNDLKQKASINRFVQ